MTSTLLQVLPVQTKLAKIVIFGKSHLRAGDPGVGIRQLLSLTKTPPANGKYFVFHARRNIEMLWGLIFKHVFKRRLKIVFTSTAQRKHSRYTKFLYHRMDAIITTSERAGSYLERKADYIIPHGVDPSEYPFVSDKQKAWDNLGLAGKKGIGIFGRVRPQKGIDLFVDAMIEALPQRPDYTAVIVGKTTPKFHPFVEEQKRKIQMAGLSERFVWLGEVDFRQLPTLYGAVSIVAAVSRVEGFGLTVLEAMSAGTAVIASRTGGWELVIREGTDGYLVPCNDSPAIAKAFIELSESNSKLATIAQTARERIESHFTVNREARQLFEVYERLAQAQD